MANPTFGIKLDRFSDCAASIKEECIREGRCDELKRKPVTKDVSAPVVQPTPKLLPPRIDEGEATSIDDLCRQISEENDRRIEGMPEEGIESGEKLLGSLGVGLGTC